MHVLTLGQDIEDFRAAIEAKVQRPVYITGGLRTWGTHYKKPRSTKYQPVGKLAMYLSTLTDDGRCVNRVSVDGDRTHDHYYYDLRESPLLYIVYPVHKAEVTKDNMYVNPIFKEVGLATGGFDRIVPNSLDKIPEALQSYVEEYKESRGRQVQAIQFARSDMILSPVHRKPTWHRAFKIERKYGPPMVTIHPPGFYPDGNIGMGEYFNRFALVDMEPGQCIVCSGAKKERRHLSHLAFGSDEVYPTNLICKGCFVESSSQIQALLDDPKEL